MIDNLAVMTRLWPACDRHVRGLSGRFGLTTARF